jgi:hypothetical protein
LSYLNFFQRPGRRRRAASSRISFHPNVTDCDYYITDMTHRSEAGQRE